MEEKQVQETRKKLCTSGSRCATPEDSKQTKKDPGTGVMILKIVTPKNFAKTLAFFDQTAASFCKNMILTLCFS
jgi:hypothetical protein